MATTLVQCQAAVDAAVALLPGYITEECPFWALFPLAEHQTAVIATGATANVLGVTSGVLADNTISSLTMPVAKILADATQLQKFARRLARLQASAMHINVLATAYGVLSSNSPIGTAGSDMTRALFEQAVNLLQRTTKIGETLNFYIEPTQFTVLKGLLDATKEGADTIRGAYVLDKLSKWAGVSLYPSPVALTGSAPQTKQSVMCSPYCFAPVTCALTLTNDSTNIQSMVATTKFGVRLALAFDASDNPAITLVQRYALTVIHNNNGVTVRA